MSNLHSVAVLGSTGYIGLELVKILLKHPNVKINFLGCENSPNESLSSFDSKIDDSHLPKLELNSDFDPSKSELVFLALPHGVSHLYVNRFFEKVKIIDLSADFRLDSIKSYYKNYQINHSCPEYLDKFIYGLPEINTDLIKKTNYIAVPGCYPTSILIPLIPLLKKNLIDNNNIIIDSKSGYSGAGKKFEIKNIKGNEDYNFYNYSTNNHRHMCEIKQEMEKFSNNSVNFSFNPHILPAYRGMLTTIYCNLNESFTIEKIENIYNSFYNNFAFVKILKDNIRADFFKVQNTNFCLIKLYKVESNKLIIVSLIDNLIKGGAGQAIQCFNLLENYKETTSFNI